jgi:hypothetical protein
MRLLLRGRGPERGGEGLADLCLEESLNLIHRRAASVLARQRIVTDPRIGPHAKRPRNLVQ